MSFLEDLRSVIIQSTMINFLLTIKLCLTVRTRELPDPRAQEDDVI